MRMMGNLTFPIVILRELVRMPKLYRPCKELGCYLETAVPPILLWKRSSVLMQPSATRVCFHSFVKIASHTHSFAGSNYSAGEKQLLALCRALVKGSRVIVLVCIFVFLASILTNEPV